MSAIPVEPPDLSPEDKRLLAYLLEHQAEIVMQSDRLRRVAIEPVGIAVPDDFESADGALFLGLPLHRTRGISGPGILTGGVAA